MRTKLEQNAPDDNPFLSESHSKLSTSKLGHEDSRPGVLPGLVQKAGGLLGGREARAVCSAETGLDHGGNDMSGAAWEEKKKSQAQKELSSK